MAKKKYNADEVVPALKKYFMSHGYMPSLEELGDTLGITSRSVIREYLMMAEQSGSILIGRYPNGRMKDRAIFIKGMRVRWE